MLKIKAEPELREFVHPKDLRIHEAIQYPEAILIKVGSSSFLWISCVDNYEKQGTATLYANRSKSQIEAFFPAPRVPKGVVMYGSVKTVYQVTCKHDTYITSTRLWFAKLWIKWRYFIGDCTPYDIWASHYFYDQKGKFKCRAVTQTLDGRSK